MNLFKKILIPVDFSKHSAQALQVGADLARSYEAAVTVVHVYEPMLYSVPESYLLYSPEQIPKLLAELERQLQERRHALLSASVQYVDTKLLQGHPVTEIVRFAEEGGYDLIVMGTHGRTGVAHALIGSVAERVIRRAPCAVLTVRTPEQTKD